MKKEIIKTQLKVKDTLVGIMRIGDVDYISLTDLTLQKVSFHTYISLSLLMAIVS